MPNWITDHRAGHVEVGGSDVVSGCTRIRVAANSDIRKDLSSGTAAPLAAHLVSVQPVISITTLELIEAFDNLGDFGACVADIKVYGQAQDCSGVVASAVHAEYAVTKGCIVPVSVTVDHQGNAEINYDLYAASPDGAASPIIRSTGVTLPIGTAGKRYEMYRVDVAGNTLEGKRNITINWNPTVTQEGADSNIYPTTVSLSQVQPVATIRGVDPGWLASIGLGGARGAQADTVIYLKDRDQATATLAHIKVAMDCAVSWNTPFDAGNDAAGEVELQLDAYSALLTTPINVSTNVALP